MSDYCAWCGEEIPGSRRGPRIYKKDDGIRVKTIDVAICEGCEERAKREKPPWKPDDKRG